MEMLVVDNKMKLYDDWVVMLEKAKDAVIDYLSKQTEISLSDETALKLTKIVSPLLNSDNDFMQTINDGVLYWLNLAIVLIRNTINPSDYTNEELRSKLISIMETYFEAVPGDIQVIWDLDD